MKTIFLLLFSAVVIISCKNGSSDAKNDTKNNKTETKNGWSEEDKKQAMRDCIGKPGSEKANSSELCDCMVGKAEALFSSYNDMNKNSEGNKDFKNALKDCDEKFSGNKETTSENNTQSGWSQDNKDAFLYRCSKMGCSDRQAKCMLQEVQKKYPNAKDAADLTEREMKDYKIDCDTD